MTYQKNKFEQDLKYTASPLKNPFLKDVTNEYFGDNKVILPFEGNLNKGNIFLGIFTPRSGWFPIGKGKVKDKKLVFENIEPFVVYQPLVYQYGELKPIHYPFMYEGKEIHILVVF